MLKKIREVHLTWMSQTLGTVYLWSKQIKRLKTA